MRIRILKRFAAMFDQADFRSARARATDKRYADRSVKNLRLFKGGYHVLIRSPPTEAKIVNEKDKQIAPSKLRYRMTGPYELLSSTLETVTVNHNGDAEIVSNDRCMLDRRLIIDEDGKYAADDISVHHDDETQDDFRNHNNAATQQTINDTAQPNENPTEDDEEIQPVQRTDRTDSPPTAITTINRTKTDNTLQRYPIDKTINDEPINDQAKINLRE